MGNGTVDDPAGRPDTGSQPRVLTVMTTSDNVTRLTAPAWDDDP